MSEHAELISVERVEELVDMVLREVFGEGVVPVYKTASLLDDPDDAVLILWDTDRTLIMEEKWQEVMERLLAVTSSCYGYSEREAYGRFYWLNVSGYNPYQRNCDGVCLWKTVMPMFSYHFTARTKRLAGQPNGRTVAFPFAAPAIKF